MTTYLCSYSLFDRLKKQGISSITTEMEDGAIYFVPLTPHADAGEKYLYLMIEGDLVQTWVVDEES